ncbi:MAG TPA: imidazole glycerol phosphate synthase subunit HisH [Acidobacteriaceae bacterium]|nr:imidazole glycerol phosphate synthase subunit HisH [Acidobacteriaceae bacterium]
MMRATVIDYQAGNLTSVVKALRHLGAEVTVTENSADVAAAERIVLPGVGHFAATRRLDETGITEAVRDAIGRGVPFLGICVGMQWLLQGSAEAPGQQGLGYFAGRCERFPEGGEKVPHVGWDHIITRTEPASARLFDGVEQQSCVYFTHSYYVPATNLSRGPGPLDPVNGTVAITHYIERFAAAVEYENVMGVQFHPEKSGEIGLRVLRNFLEWRRC